MFCLHPVSVFFFFNDTAPPDIYPLPLHDALPISGLFEPVHGSAPRHAGRGDANPMAAILTGALMFTELGEKDAARDLEQAVKDALAAGTRTPDVGGKATTREVAAAGAGARCVTPS